jgi:hypothetical protein
LRLRKVEDKDGTKKTNIAETEKRRRRGRGDGEAGRSMRDGERAPSLGFRDKRMYPHYAIRENGAPGLQLSSGCNKLCYKLRVSEGISGSQP